MLPDAARPVLDAGSVAHLAIATRSGPHAVPQAYAVAADRVWVIAPRTSVKVRVVRRRPQVGVLVRAGSRSVVLAGTATVVGPWPPADAARLALLARPAAEALASYAVRNASLLAGFALDLPAALPDSLPADRVLVAVEPDRGLLEVDGVVTDAWGEWPGGGAGGAPPEHGERPDLPAAVPPDLRTLLDERSVTVAWEGGGGPVALPGRWDAPSSVASVAADVLSLAGAAEAGPGALVFDDSSGSRPSRFSGIALRGVGRAGAGAVAVRPERVTWWRGFETGSAPTGDDVGGRPSEDRVPGA